MPVNFVKENVIFAGIFSIVEWVGGLEENALRFAFGEVFLSTDICSISLASMVLGRKCKGWILLHLHIGALPLLAADVVLTAHSGP